MSERQRNLLALLQTRLDALGPEVDREDGRVAVKRAEYRQRIEVLRAALGDDAPPPRLDLPELPPRRDVD